MKLLQAILCFVLGILCCLGIVIYSQNLTTLSPLIANLKPKNAPTPSVVQTHINLNSQIEPKDTYGITSYLKKSASRFPVSPVKGLSFFNPTPYNNFTLLNQVQLHMSLADLKTVAPTAIQEFLFNYAKLVNRINCELHYEILDKNVNIFNVLLSREGDKLAQLLPAITAEGKLATGFLTTIKICNAQEKSEKIFTKTYATPRDRLLDFFEDQQPRSFGTAWPLRNGLVVTNEHVVAGASRVYLMRHDYTFVEASVLFGDPIRDIALLKVDELNFLPPALLLDEQQYDIGNSIFTIGYPWTSSLNENIPKAQFNRGVISAIPERTASYQLSIPIQGGNSGGPLLNRAGQVIGIIREKLVGETSPGDSAQNVGFAIKIEQLKSILIDFTQEQRIETVKIGPEDIAIESLAPKIRNSTLLVMIL